MDSNLVLVDDPAPHVRRVTLNRPEKRNAVNAEVMCRLTDAWKELDRVSRLPLTYPSGLALTMERRRQAQLAGAQS